MNNEDSRTQKLYVDDLCIQIAAPGVVRIRRGCRAGMKPSLTEELGFVTLPPPPPAQIHREGDRVVLSAGALTVRLDTAGRAVSVCDGAGQPRVTLCPATAGAALELTSAPDEHYYGLGFQRQALECRGQRLVWKRAFRNRSATVPFFISSRGYACYSNNTWPHEFDFTTADAGRIRIAAEGGDLDCFLILGPDPRALLDGYTRLTGRPGLASRWALGLLYICRYFATQQEVLDIAAEFRKRDIPCDMLGLEPGWEEEDYSMEWTWSPARFPDPAGMIRQLDAMGYAFELWESGTAPEEGWMDPEVRRRWYQKRLATSVDIGVRWFKQDDPYPRSITSTQLEEPVLNGSALHSPGEVTSLANSLYSQTAFGEYRARTDKRPLILFNSYWASVAAHRWPTAWAADFGAGCGMINASLSGHAMVSMDMNPSAPQDLHYGYLLPFSLIDSWSYFQEPWLYPPHVEASHRFYAKLRIQLIPYLYSTLWQATQTGTPMLRPMALDWPAHPTLAELTSQFMLGESLLVGISGNVDLNEKFAPGAKGAKDERQRVFLPPGRWFNYWTGEVYESTGAGTWVTPAFAEPAGGPLLVKAGAIIPMAPVTAHTRAEPGELIRLDLWPHTSPSAFTLYEDDGDTYAYESGACATTAIVSHLNRDTLSIGIGPRQGAYPGMPARVYLLRIRVERQVTAVHCGTTALRAVASREALLHGADGAAGFFLDAADGTLWVKPQPGWRCDADVRGAAGDPERDTLYWTGAGRPADAGLEVTVHLAGAALDWGRAAQPPCTSADRMTVLANPPERAINAGDWLPKVTDLTVTLWHGDQPATGASATVRMEAVDNDGTVAHTAEAETFRGRAEFVNVPYVAGNRTFRFSAPGLPGCETRVRPPAPTPGVVLFAEGGRSIRHAERMHTVFELMRLVDRGHPLAALPLLWRFRTDPTDEGEKEEWFRRNPDAAWGELRTDAPWTTQLKEQYHGVAWYSAAFDVPAVPVGQRLYLRLGAVDGVAQVWIDGRSAGAQTLPPTLMWDQPFALNVTDLVRPGTTARVTVRVRKDRFDAGIWKPVELRAVDISEVIESATGLVLVGKILDRLEADLAVLGDQKT